jgi:hypothetical protein
MSDVTLPEYMGDGPVLPGESAHQALGENAVYSLGGHLLNGPAQGVSNGPHPIEDEPADATERASFKTAQNATRSASQELADGQQDVAPAFSFEDAAGQVRSSLRPGMK